MLAKPWLGDSRYAHRPQPMLSIINPDGLGKGDTTVSSGSPGEALLGY